MVAWPYALGRISWWRECVLEEFFISLGTGRRERGADYITADRKQSRALNMMGPGPDIVPKDTPPVTCFLQPGLTSCSLIVSQILFKSESINELNRSLGQSPHDLIVSGNTLTDPPGGMLY
jgi:hypothetical protein